MSAIAVERLLTWTNRTRIGVAHHVTDLIFYNITRCYGKHVAAFAVAVATGDILKYQSFVYKILYWEFTWGIINQIILSEMHVYSILHYSLILVTDYD